MGRLHVLWKLYIAYTCALLVAMSLGGWTVTHLAGRALRRQLLDDTTRLARILAERLEAEEPLAGTYDNVCVRLSRLAGMRISIIREDGKVMGDSHTPSSLMANHAGRPEFVQAREGRVGVAWRTSATLNEPFLYVAVRMPEKPLVVRVARVGEEVRRGERNLTALLSLGLYLAPALAAVAGLYVTRVLRAEKEEDPWKRWTGSGGISPFQE
jgi:two-component system phosphate regulon sensor histidine kinase PhoR